MKPLLTLTLALMATTASAQEATKAMVNMIVAEQFCALEAPKAVVIIYGEMAMKETGMDSAEFSTSAYEAADQMGKAYAKGGFLGAFCNNMRNVYQRMQ